MKPTVSLEQLVTTIFKNQNSKEDVDKAKKVIKNTVESMHTKRAPLEVEEYGIGYVTIVLTSPMPENYHFEVCNFDLRFGDLTLITEKSVREKIESNLTAIAGQSSI